MTKEPKHLTVRDLYPDLSEAELIEAEENLRRFAAIFLRVYERTQSEGIPWDTSSVQDQFDDDDLDGIDEQAYDSIERSIH